MSDAELMNSPAITPTPDDLARDPRADLLWVETFVGARNGVTLTWSVIARAALRRLIAAEADLKKSAEVVESRRNTYDPA